MSAPTSDTRRLLADELGRSEEEIDLGRAALLVAREEYPQLSIDTYLARLDQLAEEVRDRLGDETVPTLVLTELARTLFDRRAMTGNRAAYYDPRNSFLNDVLDRGLGIPLTLAMVLLEVGWRLGLPLEGVNFPAHFLVRYRGEEIRLLIDPYEGGAIHFEDEAQALLDRSYGGTVTLRPEFLRAASKRDILVRLLTNLKRLYLRVDDHRRALAAVERLLMLQPTASAERRARGMLLAKLGRRQEAARELEAYLRGFPSAGDSDAVLQMVRALRNERPPPGGAEP